HWRRRLPGHRPPSAARRRADRGFRRDCRTRRGRAVSLRIVVADDQELVRAGLSGILRSVPDLCVVGEAANGREAVTLARTERPHLVLMDIRMPELDGIEATRRITADQDIKVLILTTFDHDEYVYSALRGGASGFLLKDTPPRQLIEAVHAVATGETLLSPAITRRLIA